MGWRSSTVEQLICNQQVVGSNPIASSTYSIEEGWCDEEFVSGWSRGEVPEWPKGADCKSAGDAFEGSNPSLSTNFAGIAQLVERKPSKLGVAGSSPVSRSILVFIQDDVVARPISRPDRGHRTAWASSNDMPR